MFKIKKYVYRVLTVALALLVMLNTSAIGVLAESSGSREVTPGENDYEFLGGTITGLKTTYLNGLTDEQKQNIRLEIPGEINGEKVTAIGNSAFVLFYGDLASQKYKDCNFTKLDFTNAKYLKSIGKNAFYDCKISGSLTFPNSLTTIGENAFRQSNSFNGISGSLCFSSNITLIGKCAFSYQSGLEKIDLSNCNKLQSLPDSVFRYTGIKGVLRLPDSLQQIGSTTFGSTQLTTVYLPKKIADNILVSASSFQSSSSIKNIICRDKDDYVSVKNKLSDSNSKNAVTYPVIVNFDDGNGGYYERKKCLYGRPFSYVEGNDGTWSENKDYKFPAIRGTQSGEKAWAENPSSLLPMKETDKISGDTLYAINKLEDPVIEYGEGIDKTYDGETNVLNVVAKHSNAKKLAEAKVNQDVVFYYTWSWDTINATPAVEQGFDINSLDMGADVRAPYGICCCVRVQACVLMYNDVGKKVAHVFYQEDHEFLVNLRQAESTVNPNVTSGVYKMSEGQTTLPEIQLSAGDTPGTIAWDADQTLKEGFGIYTWTFTPEPNGVDNNTTSNFKVTKGQVELYATTKDVDTKSLEDKIDDIPEISEEKPVTEEEKDKILDAYFAYESSEENVKEKVSEEKLEKIYDAISKLPQVETAAEGLQLVNEKDLLKNMTSKDAAAIKDQEKAKCTIKVVSNKETPDEQITDAIKLAAGSEAKIGEHFDVKVAKIIENGANPTTEDLTTVKIPLNLVFDVPEVLQSSNRKFFIIRAHKDANGTITAEKLEDEDTNPATITVTSDKFSTYAIAYTEEESSSGSSGGNSYVYNISASASEHGAITPEGKVSANYGSAKTFSFTPDEGYKVADVIVDGVSVGAVSSYTFDNIVKAHTISVTFEPIADDQDRIINGIKATTIKASSAAKKGSITIKWKKSAGFKMDYFQVFRSTKMNSGYGNKAFYTTKTGTQKSYKNTKKLRKGTRYYYKVRGVRTIYGVKVYTKWSNKAIRIAK